MNKTTGATARISPNNKGISTVWLIPVVAAVIGGWLIFKAISEQGPAITIEWQTGTGIEAGKTKVKYKGIEVGEVESVNIKKDLSGVIVGVRLESGADFVLTDKTRFWIVKPRISAGQVSGLGTLLSGAYIGIDPVPGGKKQRRFTGLENPPAVLTGEPGKKFRLRSPNIASMDIGSPIYFHGLQVGRVSDFKMDDDGEVIFDIYIHEPHDKKIVDSTRFWNAGGLNLELGANGVRLQTASIATLLAGGIAFDTSKTLDAPTPVDEDHMFRLFDSEQASKAGEFEIKEYYLLKFAGSLRGLEIDAPVEFRGIRVGTVEDIIIKRRTEGQRTLEIPVLIAIEPQRYDRDAQSDTVKNAAVAALVKQGLRASLKTGNLLTGKKFIDLGIFPDADSAELDLSGRYPAIPTIDDDVGELLVDTQKLIKELRVTATRFNDLLETPENGQREGDLAATLSSIRGLSDQINAEIAPNLNATLVQAEKTLANAQSMLADDATTRTELNRLLIELTEVTRSIRAAADYIEQHPESIIYGKDE